MKSLFKEIKEKLALLTDLRSEIRELMNHLLEDGQIETYLKLKEIDKKLKEIIC